MDNISFKLYNGDILGIIGPNGAGKTTLFRCILGIEYEYYGNILIFNKDIRKNKNVFQKIGYVLDGVSTIANNVVFINRKMFFHDNRQNFSKIVMTYFLTFSPASNIIILGVTFQKKNSNGNDSSIKPNLKRMNKIIILLPLRYNKQIRYG